MSVVVMKPTAQPSLTRPVSKSRFRLACECPTKLYYNDRPKEYGNDKLDDAFLQNLAKGGFQVGALAKLYFPGGTEISTLDYKESLEQTTSLLEQPNVTIYEAAFHFENLFIRADIVNKEGTKLFLYEVKAKSYNADEDTFWQKREKDHLDSKWKPYLYDIAFQYYVVRNAYPELEVVPHLFLANKKSTSTVDGLNQLFRLVKAAGRDKVLVDEKLSGSDLGARILVEVNVSDQVEAIQSGKPNGKDAPDWPKELSFAAWLKYLALEYRSDSQMAPKVTGECKGCEFRIDKRESELKSGFEECWTKALALRPGEFDHRIPIFGIWGLQAPKLLEKGVYFIDSLSEDDLIPKTKSKTVEPSGLNASRRRVLQWSRTLENSSKHYFDKGSFLKAIEDYAYPLHFIDFETSMVAIPFNKGRRPYEQIAFQFSHHVLEKDSTIAHKGQWISEERGSFPNFDFVRALKKELEHDRGTIFRYSHHENTVLGQIRKQLQDSEAPDRKPLVQWIESITEPSGKCPDPWQATRPMVDLLELVVRFFWHPRMGGSNSMKVVLLAILEASAYLQAKYSKPVYGAPGGIKSLNYKDHTWLKREPGGGIQDPYGTLPQVFDQWERNTLDRMYSEDELADGGAAMMAYAKIQFSEMSKAETTRIAEALLRYCELDTLAMVMLWEGWLNLENSI